MTLANSAINNCTGSWDIALVAIITVVVFNIWGKGMLRIIPILLGVLVSYVYAAITGRVDFSGVASAAWIGLPVKMENTVFSLIGNCDMNLLVTAVIAIMPIAFATMIEHIGDICAISSTVGENFIADPGPAPHAAGRRSGDDHRFPVRRAGQHHLRREYRRSGADPRV